MSGAGMLLGLLLLTVGVLAYVRPEVTYWLSDQIHLRRARDLERHGHPEYLERYPEHRKLVRAGIALAFGILGVALFLNSL
jgi:hypothetical protein